MSIQKLRSLVNSGLSIKSAVEQVYDDADPSFWEKLLSSTPRKSKKNSRGRRSSRKSFRASSVLPPAVQHTNKRNLSTAEQVDRVNGDRCYLVNCNGNLTIMDTNND